VRAARAKRWLQGGHAAGGGSDGGIDEPRPAPDCPPGWRTAPPDFVGVGVQRSGTSRWFGLISAHPEIATPNSMKELHFFDRFHSGGWDEDERAAYERYFPRPAGAKAGEWTPLYASAPWVAPLLAHAAPRARLLMLVRDPVERWRSGMQLDATVAARRGAPLSRYAPLEAFVRGLYHAQLERLLRHFERSRVLLLQYERCSAQPEVELERTYAFLGVRDTSFRPDLGAHPREQPDKPALDERARTAYVDAYSEDVLALAASFTEIDLSLWPNFAHLA
jgi:Sulfotransferase domain